MTNLKGLLNSMVKGINDFLNEYHTKTENALINFNNAKDNLKQSSCEEINACDMVIDVLSDIIKIRTKQQINAVHTIDMVNNINNVTDEYNDNNNESSDYIGECEHCGCDIFIDENYIENEDGTFYCEDCAGKYINKNNKK